MNEIFSPPWRFRFNTGLAKVAVQCSAETFVVNQSLVLRINICGENRHLRQARKRFHSMILHVFNIPVNPLLRNARMYMLYFF
jgi:hypothetical protein